MVKIGHLKKLFKWRRFSPLKVERCGVNNNDNNQVDPGKKRAMLVGDEIREVEIV
jgi:hypothetical protein